MDRVAQRIGNYPMLDIMRYVPDSWLYQDSYITVNEYLAVTINNYRLHLEFKFEGDGIICISDHWHHQEVYDTHAYYCQKVANKDILRNLTEMFLKKHPVQD